MGNANHFKTASKMKITGDSRYHKRITPRANRKRPLFRLGPNLQDMGWVPSQIRMNRRLPQPWSQSCWPIHTYNPVQDIGTLCQLELMHRRIKDKEISHPRAIQPKKQKLSMCISSTKRKFEMPSLIQGLA
jgi:hypothetical protein